MCPGVTLGHKHRIYVFQPQGVDSAWDKITTNVICLHGGVSMYSSIQAPIIAAKTNSINLSSEKPLVPSEMPLSFLSGFQPQASSPLSI